MERPGVAPGFPVCETGVFLVRRLSQLGRRARSESNAVHRIWNPIGLHDLVPGVTGGSRTRTCRATTCRAIRYTTATRRRQEKSRERSAESGSNRHLSGFNRALPPGQLSAGDPWGNRTPVPRVKTSDPSARRTGRIGAAAENRTQWASLRGRIPTIGSTAHVAARGGFEPPIGRLTAACLAAWLPCNRLVRRELHPRRAE